MANPKRKPEPTLYERDFFAWTQDQAEKLRARAHNEVDWENVAEEIESVGRSQRSEIESRLALLILHLLKWQLQPGRRSESWRISISEQRIWIPNIIKASPGLRTYPAEAFLDAYKDGRRRAINETGLLPKIVPVEPTLRWSRCSMTPIGRASLSRLGTCGGIEGVSLRFISAAP